jgi:hypothetical protein
MPPDDGLRFDNERTSDQRGQMRRRVVQNNRSQAFKDGRGRRRLSTATCWRRVKISRAVSPRARTKTLSATTRRGRTGS